MDANLKNVLWCYTATGSGLAINMNNVFSLGAVGGAFYETQYGWLCTGPMTLSNNIISFKVWMDDTMTSGTEGVKDGQSFKLLVYENNQWFDIIPTKVRTITGIKNYDENTFKAKNLNFMTVPDPTWIKKLPTDIIPSVNPDLLINMPEIYGSTEYQYGDGTRKIVIKNVLSWCSFDGFEVKDMPTNWICSRVGTTNDIAVHIYRPFTLVDGQNPKVIVKAKPYNSLLSQITKTVELVKL